MPYSAKARQDRAVQREISRQLGPADTRKVAAKTRRNVYVTDAPAAALAMRGELSHTIDTYLRIVKGTTMGKWTEANARIAIARREHMKGLRELEKSVHRLRDNLAKLEGIILEPEDLERAVHDMRDEIPADVLDILEGSADAIAKAVAMASVCGIAANIPDVAVVATLGADGSMITGQVITVPSGSEGEIVVVRDPMIVEQILVPTKNLLLAHVSEIVAAAQLILAAVEQVERYEDQFNVLASKWEAQAVKIFADLAGTYTKFREARGTDDPAGDLVWCEGHVTNMLAALGVDVSAEEILRVLLAYLEGGPPDGLKALYACF